MRRLLLPPLWRPGAGGPGLVLHVCAERPSLPPPAAAAAPARPWPSANTYTTTPTTAACSSGGQTERAGERVATVRRLVVARAAAAQESSQAPAAPAPPTAASPDDAPPGSPPTRAFSTSAAAAQNKAGGGKKQRMRLDEACMELAPHLSRNVIQSWIAQGKVTVDGRVVSKAGTPVLSTAKVVLAAQEPKYVCRAGHKLEKALEHFGVDPAGLVCLDSGQSTGGFTDCLLQRGAARVYGIDVGYGQVADKVRRDPRVVVMERFNVRHLKPQDLPEQVDLATLDLSFISVLKVVPAVARVLRGSSSSSGVQPLPAAPSSADAAAAAGSTTAAAEEGALAAPRRGPAQMLVLIKPQFEAGRQQVSSGGVVRDPRVHAEVCARVRAGIEALGFECRGITESPLKGDKSGNTEFLAHFVRDASRAVDPALLQVPTASDPDDEEDQEVPAPKAPGPAAR